MKKRNRINLVALSSMAIAFMLVSILSAPKAHAFGGMLELALPSGDFGDGYNTGYGFSGNLQMGSNPNIKFMIQVGYIHWSGKNVINGLDYNCVAIPLQAGPKYYFKEGSAGFFVGGLMGIHGILTTAEVRTQYGNSDETRGEPKVGFAPIAGYRLISKGALSFEFSARYQFVSDDFSYFGLSGGLVF